MSARILRMQFHLQTELNLIQILKVFGFYFDVGKWVMGFVNKTSEAHASEVLCLGVSHLLNTLFLDLALGCFGRQKIHLSFLRRADDQLEKFLMIVDGIVNQGEIG